MKKIGYALCSLLLVFCAVGFGACGGTPLPTEKQVFSVAQTGLKEFYHVTDTIDFSALKINVKYDDNSTATLTKGEFDINAEDAKSDTQFIVNTSGLYSQTAGEMTVGEYALSCVLIGKETVYQLGKINVSNNMNLIYDLTAFNEPDFVSTYKDNIVVTENDENSFYKTSTAYYVGDDNEFRFKPKMTLQSKTSGAISESDNFNVTVKVEMKNGDTYDVVTGDTYFTYDNFAFDFTENAIGKTFRITMTPMDFEKDFAGNNVEPVVFVVTVEDGWNVYSDNAIDLGRMSLVSDNFASVANTYIRPESAAIFYNEDTGAMKEHRKYYELWKNYLTEKGCTDLAPVNGMFIHGDIKVTPSDMPSEFFVSQKEAEAKGMHLLGSLRDFTLIYTHYMENNFNFNGNYFKLDFSEIPWGLSNTGKNGFYYDSDETRLKAGHSTVFNFLHKADESNDTIATFKNVDAFGNTRNITSVSNTTDDNLKASGGLIFMKSISGTTQVENCIAKAWMIAWFSETTTAKNALELDYIKTYDCFNSGAFSWHSEKSTLTNSEFKRFGGPVILMVSGAKDGVKESGAGWTVDKETTTLESYISGQEGWFVLNGATTLVTQFLGADVLLNAYGTTIKNTENKMNMVGLIMDDEYITSTEKNIFANFSYGGVPFDMQNVAGNPIYDIWNAYNYAPSVFMSNGGQLALTISDTELAFPAGGDSFSGDLMYVGYPITLPSASSVSTVAGLIVDRYDYTAPSA